MAPGSLVCPALLAPWGHTHTPQLHPRTPASHAFFEPTSQWTDPYPQSHFGPLVTCVGPDLGMYIVTLTEWVSACAWDVCVSLFLGGGAVLETFFIFVHRNQHHHC